MNRFKKEQLKKQNVALIADIIKGDRTRCDRCKEWHTKDEELCCVLELVRKEIRVKIDKDLHFVDYKYIYDK